jgi:hypothetical protein
MLKHTITAAAITVTLAAASAAPAFAQSTMPDPMAKPASVAQSPLTAQSAIGPHENFVQTQHATDWRGSKLIGAVVYGPDNASIGAVNDVLIGNDGQVRALVIGVGGFLGVGEKDVAIPLDALNIARKPESSSIEKITVSFSKDDLKNAPIFAYYEPNNSQTTGSNVSDKIKSLNPMSDPKK